MKHVRLQIEQTALRIGFAATIKLNPEKILGYGIMDVDLKQVFDGCQFYQLPSGVVSLSLEDGDKVKTWTLKGSASAGSLFGGRESIIDFSKPKNMIVGESKDKAQYKMSIGTEFQPKMLKFLPQRLVVNGVHWAGFHMTYDGREFEPDPNATPDYHDEKLFLVRPRTRHYPEGRVHKIWEQPSLLSFFS